MHVQPGIAAVERGYGDYAKSKFPNFQARLDDLEQLAGGADVLLLGMRLPPSFGGEYAEAFAALFERVGRPVLDSYGLLPRVDAVAALYRDNAALALVTSGYTPVPYVLYGIVAGSAGIPLGTFVLFSAIGRGIKYAILGLLASVAGPPIRGWLIRSRRRLAAAAAIALLIIVYLLLRTIL